MFVEIELKDILEHPLGNGSVLLLQESKGSRVCLINVGPVEASMIADQLEGVVTPRPMAHDLVVEVLSCSGSALQATYIERVLASTYYAALEISQPDGGTLRIDARPSDAITIALKQDRPIYMHDQLLNCNPAVNGHAPCEESDILSGILESGGIQKGDHNTKRRQR